MQTNSFFLATVANFKGDNATPDKNGLEPVILDVLAGTCPNKRVLAGTVAMNLGLESGNSYMLKWTQLEDDTEYGTQYGFTLVHKIVDPLQIISVGSALGPAKLIGE